MSSGVNHVIPILHHTIRWLHASFFFIISLDIFKSQCWQYIVFINFDLFFCCVHAHSYQTHTYTFTIHGSYWIVKAWIFINRCVQIVRKRIWFFSFSIVRWWCLHRSYFSTILSVFEGNTPKNLKLEMYISDQSHTAAEVSMLNNKWRAIMKEIK